MFVRSLRVENKAFSFGLGLGLVLVWCFFLFFVFSGPLQVIRSGLGCNIYLLVPKLLCVLYICRIWKERKNQKNQKSKIKNLHAEKCHEPSLASARTSKKKIDIRIIITFLISDTGLSI